MYIERDYNSLTQDLSLLQKTLLFGNKSAAIYGALDYPSNKRMLWLIKAVNGVENAMGAEAEDV